MDRDKLERDLTEIIADGYADVIPSRTIARAVLARLDSLGLIVVPKEPTPDMVDAGRDVGPDAPYGLEETRERYRAMIAAAK